MPDSPDYSRYNVNGLRQSLQDLGELSVRLGAASRIYRSGSTILADDYSNGLMSWIENSLNAANKVTLQAVHSLFSPYAAQMVVSAPAGTRTEIYTLPASILTGKIGFEVGLYSPSAFGIFDLDVYQFLAAISYHYSMRLHGPNKTISILNSAGAYTVLNTGVLSLGAVYALNFVKMTIDPTTHKYSTLLCNDVIINASAYDARAQISAPYPDFAFVQGTQNVSGANETIQSTHAIITQDEPW